MRRSIRSLKNPPTPYPEQNWFVQIPAPRDQKAVQIPYPNAEFEDQMFQLFVYTS